jgi:hypothetical protein
VGSTDQFEVLVVDTTPPALSLPSLRVTAEASNASGALVNYPAATATDLVTAAPTLSYSRASGSLFPIGETMVSVSAEDGAGNVSSGSFMVVVDKLAQTLLFDRLPDRLVSEGAIRLEATSSSGLPVEWSVTGPATLGGGSLVLTGTGQVTVTASQPGDTIHAAAEPVVRKFAVLKNASAQTIVFDVSALRVTYGDSPIVLAGTASSGLPLSFAVVGDSPAKLRSDGSTLEITGAGVVTVRASQSGNTAYGAASSVSSSFTVGKRKLRVAAQDRTRLVRAENPSFPLVYNGFVNGDSASVLDVQPSTSTTASVNSPVGVYPISVRGGSDANYEFEYTGGQLTVRGFGGNYETLLFDQTDAGARIPVGRLELTIPENSMTYSGVLSVAGEVASVRLSGGVLSSVDGGSLASGTLVLRNRRSVASVLPDLTIQVGVSQETQDGLSAVVEAGSARLRSAGTGVKLAARALAPHGGTYTLLISPASKIETSDARSVPSGYGYAAVRIDPSSGLLTMAGRLADGSTFSAPCRPDGEQGYRVFFMTHAGRTGSYVAGSFNFERGGPAYSNAFLGEGRLVWRKAARLRDEASFSAGFGPLEAAATLERWQAPNPSTRRVAGVALSNFLRLTRVPIPGAGTYGLEVAGVGAAAGSVPGVTAVGQLDGNSRTITFRVNSGSRLALDLNPATGVFTGGFFILDPVPGSSESARRWARVAGVFRQGPSGEVEIGAGHVLAPSSVVGAEGLGGKIRFTLSGE